MVLKNIYCIEENIFSVVFKKSMAPLCHCQDSVTLINIKNVEPKYKTPLLPDYVLPS